MKSETNKLAKAIASPLDEAMECLAMILSFHNKAADPAQLKHLLANNGSEIKIEDITRLTKKQGLKVKNKVLNIEELKNAPFPLIAKTKDNGWFAIGAFKDDIFLVQRPRNEPQPISSKDLEEAFSGEVILNTVRIGDNIPRPFDVTWFIPALMRYRKLLGEVLASSFILQLLGLATPLFFQVVIDKVLVHHGLTTLDVIAFGLCMVIIIESLLGGLRAYLFTHTTSRVDVELGAKLYQHLVSLPMSYFHLRRVGDSVARVRELETIREFLTSSAATLVIDLIFTILFLAIMWFYNHILFIITLISLVLYFIVSVGAYTNLKTAHRRAL